MHLDEFLRHFRSSKFELNLATSICLPLRIRDRIREDFKEKNL